MGIGGSNLAPLNRLPNKPKLSDGLDDFGNIDQQTYKSDNSAKKLASDRTETETSIQRGVEGGL